jgi:Domain of unknown function (DUF4826)
LILHGAIKKMARSKTKCNIFNGECCMGKFYAHSMNSDDYDDPTLEAQWLSEQRNNVQSYIQNEGVQHGGIASEPEWFVAPYASVWTIDSMVAPGVIGWWAISGDLPTDYLSGHDATDARSALAAFAIRWREVSAYMLRGEEHPTISVGRSRDRHKLGDLLLRRAQVLEEWADDDEMWQTS